MAEPVFLVTGISRKGEKAALLHFKDNTIKPVWTPDFELAQTLVGKPIPADWVRKDGEYGPQAFPPKKGGSGGAPAWRNTKEGFLAEQEGRQRWQQIEEERKDRRTALMTAVEWLGNADMFGTTAGNPITDMANHFYQWLRSSPAAGPAVTPTEGVATKGVGPVVVAGSPAGDTSLAEGEAAGKEPGEGSSSLPSSGFPIDPSKCDHKRSGGGWVRWKTISVNVTSYDDATPQFITNEVCPKCGTPKLVAMEGTTADLGPA